MARTSFAQRVLTALGLLVLATMALLAVEMGLMGADAQSWLRSQWHPLHELYLRNKTAVDLAILVVGTSVPAVAGGLAILRKFYYSEIMLPRRLQELANALKERHLAQRVELLAYVQGAFKTRDFLAPVIFSNPVSKLLNLVGYVSTRNQARFFATSVGMLDDQIRTLNTKIEDLQNQKVTGHLIRAAYFSAQASELEAGGPDRRGSIESARKEYLTALDLRELDLDALEGAVAESRALEDETGELQYLNRIVTAADPKKQPLRHARAQRQIAEIHGKRALSKSWDEARTRLVTATRLLEQRIAYGTEEVSEMAASQLLYGEIQTKREKFSAARTALQRADDLFSTLNGERGADGKRRVKDARARLDAAAGDKEAPGDE